MTDRSQPFIDVTVNGAPASDAFYRRLTQARIHDAPGQAADTVELTFDDARNEVAIPARGAIIVVRFGFLGGGTWKMGRFVYERWTVTGGEDGEFVQLSGRSADMRKEVKEPLSEHFDDKTLGAIVKETAGRHGHGAKVHSSLASVKLDYVARIEQSSLDFLTRLGDRFDAQFSIKDGLFLLMPRAALAAVAVDRSECVSWEFSGEPRPRFGKTAGGWFDRAKGRVEFEEHSTALEGPSRRLRNLLPSQAEAKAAAKSEGGRLGRATGSGSITLAGRPEINADVPLALTGFRGEANGLWSVAGVDHAFAETYTTTVELEAPPEGKT